MVALWIVMVDSLGLYGYLSQRLFLLNPVWLYLSIYGILFGFYAYAAGRIVPRIPETYARQALWLILIGGVIFRLVALPTQPSLSTDMDRYVWDGRLTMHGINPYRWAPNAQTLRWLRDPVWDAMDYKSYQTIYMPVSQIVFAVCNFFFKNSLIGYKLIYTLFDIGVTALLLPILRALKRDPMHVIWYAWCPLPITEVSLAGHQDVVGVFFLMLTFVIILRKRNVWLAGVTLVCAVLTKGFALMLVPMMVRNYGKRFALAAAVSLIYFGMPLWVYLPQFLHGMNQYLDNVHVNSSLFNWTNMALLHVTSLHYEIANRLSQLAILTAAAWAAWRRASGYADLIRRAFIVLAVILMVVPTLFPWYLVWVLPFLPLVGKRPSWAFVALVCTIGLLYTYYISIKPLWWTPILEYVPFYLILAWEYAGWRLGCEPIGYLRRRWLAVDQR
jgi:alpha-1,6-mannosyltransferase